jgi:peptidyl-prolyl cis-trans isomerase SurA
MQEVVRASHILFQFPPNPSREDSLSVLRMALKVKEEIENGGNINELALNYSDDPSAKINRGDLGYFTSLQMVQPFEDAVFSLQTGKVSDPVLTNFGYHIIQVKDRLPNPGQVRVSHILVRFDPADPEQESNARRKISDIYSEIQKESTIWEEIVKTFSEDPGTKENGGLLPWFGVGTMIPEFEMAAFSLAETGEISPPLKTQYGYHILRLEGKKQLETFEQLEESIRSRILRDSRSGLIQSQVTAIQKARYAFRENEANVSKLALLLKDASVDSMNRILDSAAMTELELFSLQGRVFKAADLLKFIQEEDFASQAKKQGFESVYGKFVTGILAKTEEKDLESNNKEYQMLLKEYRDGILLFSLMNQEVWQKGIADSLGQVEFYQKNPANFQWKNRIDAFLVRVIDSGKLPEARKILQSSGFNPSVFKSFESDYKANSPLAYTSELGTFEYEDHPVISRLNLDLPYQEFVLEGSTYVVVLGKKIPAGPRKFEESRGLVIRDYQEFLEKRLNEKLKEKYPVEINESLKEQTFAMLNKPNSN